MKVVPRLEVVPFVWSGAQTDSITLCWVIWTLQSPSGSEGPQMSKQGAGNTHLLTIPQKTLSKRRHESGENQREVLASYSFVLSTVDDTKKGKYQLQSSVVSSVTVQDLYKPQTLKELRFAQLYRVLYKWFTAVCLKENL